MRNHGGMHKHATASVFLFRPAALGGWHIVLVHHPRYGRWMLPGGHVEPEENPAEAALREVAEETGYAARLLDPYPDPVDTADLSPGVPLPVRIGEYQVPAERRHPHPHVHVDYLYVALAGQPRATPELRFDWFDPTDLAGLDMFPDTRALAGRFAARFAGRLGDLTRGPR